MKILGCLLALIFLGFINTSGQERYVMPVDEAQKDASFYQFRTKLIAAAERRDMKYILGIIDPKIELSFGGDAGIADFKRIWKIERKDSEFWTEFLRVIKNGGTFGDAGSKQLNEFRAPYISQVFPTDLDEFEHHAIFGKNVNMRERPDPAAHIVATLSYNVVKVDFDGSVKAPGDTEVFAWLKCETLGGKKGFVKAEFVRSPIDYRAVFVKKRGKWKMTVFIAGD